MTIKKALESLIEAADDLIAAIEGTTTDQFEMQVMQLQDAVSYAEQILQGGAL
jgi:hypothetical protein